MLLFKFLAQAFHVQERRLSAALSVSCLIGLSIMAEATLGPP